MKKMLSILILLIGCRIPENKAFTISADSVDITARRLQEHNGLIYYDFDVFGVAGVNPIPMDLVGKEFPYVEVENKTDSVIVKTHLNQDYFIEKILVKKSGYYYEKDRHMDNDIEFIYERFYTNNYIIEFGFDRDLLNNTLPEIFSLSLFMRDKKVLIRPNQLVSITPSLKFNIDTFPENKIATKEVDQFIINEKCLLTNHEFKSYFNSYHNVKSKEICFDNIPFNKNRFSYYWYIFLPSLTEAHAIRDILGQ